jgi:hypothetical protein
VHSESRPAAAVAQGQFWNLEGGKSTVGSRYPRTGEGQQAKRTQGLYSELQADCL